MFTLKAKNLIFSILVFTSFTAFGQDIKAVYESNKNKIKVDQAVDIDGFLFSSSISKANTSIDVLIDKNKMNATAKILDYQMNLIKWPKNISDDLKYMMWHHYLKATNKQNVSGIIILENGQIGKNYYVVLGVETSKIVLDNVNYEKILESLR